MYDGVDGPQGAPRLADTVPGLIAGRAARTPHQPAWCVAGGGGTWAAIDWADYAGQVRMAAAGLAALGIGARDRVAILAPVSLRWEIADKALLFLGAVVVGVDLHASREDRAFILSDAQVKGCIVARASDLGDLPPQIVDGLNFIVALDGPAAPGGRRIHTWDQVCKVADAPLPAPPRADHPATLVYTSGTTGRPKAILYTHGQLTLACAALLDAFAPVTAQDRGVCWLPLSNMFQRVMNLCSIGAGCRTYFVEDPRRLMDLLPSIAPTILIGVPRLYEKVYKTMQERIAAMPVWQRALMDFALRSGARVAGDRRAGQCTPVAIAAAHRALDRAVLRRLRAPFGGAIRFLVSGSAPLAPAIMQFFESAGLLILEAYGLSENIVPVAVNRPGAYRPGSVGRPLPPNELQLAEDGEVLVRGPGLFRGYESATTTKARLNGAGYLATGDIGEFDTDGFLFLRGRKNDIIKTSTGRRVAPNRIEGLLRQVPAVDQALVIGDGREVLTAIVALDAAQAPKHDEIAAAVQAVNDQLADYERIRGVLVLSQGLSIAAGQLTASLKPRRAFIAGQNAAAIEALYTAIRTNRAEDLPIVVAS